MLPWSFCHLVASLELVENKLGIHVSVYEQFETMYWDRSWYLTTGVRAAYVVGKA